MTTATATKTANVELVQPHVLRHALKGRRRSILSMAIGFPLYAIAIAPLFQTMKDTLASYNENLPEGVSEALGFGDLATPEGFVNAEVFSFVPLILGGLAAAWGARALGGREQDGTLGTTLGLPLARRTLAVSEIAALVGAIALISLTTLLGTFAADAIGGLGLRTTGIVAVVTGQAVLALASAGVAFAVGAATGKRAWALTAGLAFLIGGYVLDTVSKLVDSVEFLGWFSGFHWYNANDPLLNGFDVPGLLVLSVVAAGSFLLGIRAFERRDLAI